MCRRSFRHTRKRLLSLLLCFAMILPLFMTTAAAKGPEDAVGLIVNGYAQEVLAKLPMEFAVEARKLLQVSLEGSVG